jgi:guanylate kinase
MLLAISGPSTVGKDSTWARIAEEFGFSREVPFTTRPRRSSEVDGRDYHFVNAEEFRRMIKKEEVTAWDFILGNYYGTSLSLRTRVQSGEKVVLQVLGRMAIRLKSRLPDVRTVMLQVSDQTMLRSRLELRGYQHEEIEDRLKLADEELIHSPMFDFVVPDADILTDQQVRRVILEVITEVDGAK